MRLRLLPLACLFVLGLVPARAQVNLHIDIGLPVAPPLVVVRPGVQVVEGFDEEVFFSSGWYWCRRPNGWYRARSPRARFEWVEVRRVPGAIVRMPEGHYRNWHRDHRVEKWERREEHRERREEHRERQEERRERHEERHGRDHHREGEGRRDR